VKAEAAPWRMSLACRWRHQEQTGRHHAQDCETKKLAHRTISLQVKG
jgi:hypothetical protein